jgi:uncharacterized protein (TIGR00730 family)
MSQSRNPNKVLSLCVFCGSRPGTDPDFFRLASELGGMMASEGIRLVFGGGAVGLMGAVADAVVAGNGDAIGVIPDFLANREISHRSVKLEVVPDMHTRKKRMFELADAFCVLPGGFGTLEEFFEIVTWRQLSVHAKPILLANWNGYWDPLIAMGQRITDGGFGYGPMEELLTVVAKVEEILTSARREIAEIKPNTGPGHPKLSQA